MRALFAADGTSLRPGVGERSPLTRFRSFLRLDEQPDPPLMIQGVRHAWDVFALPAAEPIWFERFLTPQFRCAMSAVEGCEAYAVFSAEDIPESLRSKPWMSLIKSVRDYSCLDPDQRVALLRALGALSLYWDVERLISRHPFPVSAAASSKARHDLIRERVRFLLREQRLGRDRTFVFLDIARRAPEGSLERLEASIFFLSRALEGLQQRGRLGVVVPRSMLSKVTNWHEAVLEKNTLDAVIILPDELFAPYASSYTAVVLMTKGIKHSKNHKVFWGRIENDGFRRRKSVRVHCEGEQLSLALKAYKDHETIAGFCGWSPIADGAGWDAGYYIPARPLSEMEVNEQAALLTRNSAAFVVAHAPELAALNDAVARGELIPQDYRTVKGKSQDLFVQSSESVISTYFDIYYGQKSLHSKEGLTPGTALIISASGIDNGCYGFFDFDDVIATPFVTVPSTGSIGRAHVQKWPCGVTDDCLILMPKKDTPRELLYVAAAVIRHERWRFNYGRKITPDRIANYPIPTSKAILSRVRKHISEGQRIEDVAIEMAEDNYDAGIAQQRMTDKIVYGAALVKRLAQID